MRYETIKRHEPDDVSASHKGLSSSLTGAALHEVYAAAEPDSQALAGFALLAARSLAKKGQFVWVRHVDLDREAGAPYAQGLAELGIDPASVLLVRGGNVEHVLQAGLDAARSAAVGAALLEFRGAARAYDLTASRRLMQAARTSGARVFVLRSAAQPCPSAAETRWLLRSARSSPLAANAPGGAAFDLTLLRNRRGREGLTWSVEWNRERGCFDQRNARSFAEPQGKRPGAPLSGGLAPLSPHRPAAAADDPAIRRASG